MVTAAQYDQKVVSDIINDIIQEHFMIEELRTLVASFIQFKQMETTVWWKLPLYIHKLMGGQSEKIHYAAAQAELLILALDIIDDLQDQDNFKPPWMHCDPFIAANIASALLIIGMNHSEPAPLSTAITKQLMYAHNGQYYDYLNLISTDAEYYHLIKQKSAALIALVLLMGYQLTNNPTDDGKDTIIELANYIGTAAQLQNDLKDIHLFNERSDIVQRKRTIATMHLLNRSKEHFPILQQYYDKLCTFEELLSYQSEFPNFVQASGVKPHIRSIQHENGIRADGLINKIAFEVEYMEAFKKIAVSPFLNNV